jgi:hypothetical protein
MLKMSQVRMIPPINSLKSSKKKPKKVRKVCFLNSINFEFIEPVKQVSKKE